MTWDAFLLNLEKIPGPVWGLAGAVLGGLMAQVSTWISNRKMDQRQEIQLRHDREIRDREREMHLRRDIYLAASEAVQAGLVAITRFADLSIPDNKVMEDYTQRSSTFAKVQIIASLQTTSALSELNMRIQQASMRLMLVRAPIMKMKFSHDLLDRNIAEAGKQRDRWLEEIRQFNVRGQPDQRLWNLLQSNFDFEQNRVKEILEASGPSRTALGTANLALLETSLQEVMSIHPLLPPLIAAVRAELDIAFDAEAYTELLRRSAEAQNNMLKNFLHQIHGLINESQKKEAKVSIDQSQHPQQEKK